IEREIEACRRRFEALDFAIEEAENELSDVVDAHRKEWLSELDEKITTARAEYAAAIETLSTARVTLAKELSVRRWIAAFPVPAVFRMQVPGVPQLVSPNGDPYFWEQVVAALMDDATPPPVVEERPPVQQGWPAMGRVGD